MRKAVSSSALTKALGFPWLSNKVKEPRGTEAGFDSSDIEEAKVVPDMEVGRDLGPLVEDCVDLVDPIDNLLRSGVVSGLLTESRVITLTPMPELLDAGMNKLVAPSVLFM